MALQNIKNIRNNTTCNKYHERTQFWTWIKSNITDMVSVRDGSSVNGNRIIQHVQVLQASVGVPTRFVHTANL